MKATAFPFVGGSDELKRKKFDVQRTVNMFPADIESGTGKSRKFLQSVPGLRVFSLVPEVCIPPAIASFTATNQGEGEWLLEWEVTGSISTLMLVGGAVDLDVTGSTSVTVTPDTRTTYTLTVTSACGTDTADVDAGPLAGGFVQAAGNSSGTWEPFPLDTPLAGDYIFLIFQDSLPNEARTIPAGFSNVVSFGDSGGTSRCTFLSRVADGTSADTDIVVTFSNPVAVNYVVVLVRNALPSYSSNSFPAYLVPSFCYDSSVAPDAGGPNSVTATPLMAGPFVNLVVNFQANGNTSLGYGLTYTAAPPGYTLINRSSGAFAPDFQIKLASAWSISSTTTETVAGFPRTGSIGTGGEGGMLLRVPYTP